jgi:hypothetical protein
VQISAEAATDGIASWVQRSTDAQGRIDLRLAPAGYRLQFDWDRSAEGKPVASPWQPARFDWTANGPAQAVLKVAKKP